MKNDMTKTKDTTEQYTETTRDYITTEVTTESEGPKETTEQCPVIYMLADLAIIKADTQLNKIYYPGTSMNEVIESLNDIKSILNTIKLESRSSYNEKRDNN